MKNRFLLFLILWLVAAAPVSAQRQREVVRSTRTVFVDGSGYFLHSVQRKETLYSIAKAYGVSVEAINKANSHLGERLVVNSTLLIPIPSAQVSPLANPHPKEFIAVPASTVHHPDQVPLGSIDTEALSLNQPTRVGRIRSLTNPARGIEVAMLLPFGGRSNEANFVEFLCGALLATETLKDEGVSVRLNVHSTESRVETVHSLIASGVLDRADVLIGPVYEAPFEVAGAWATERHVPIVSPLGSSGSLDNPYVICAAPSETTKYEALRVAMTNPLAKISYIDCGADNDEEWAQAAARFLPVDAARLVYQGKKTEVTELTDLLSREVPNVIILPTSNETLTEAILSRFSSINAVGRYNITVVGTPRWGRFVAMNLELFFKLNASYTTSYHADRRSAAVESFFKRYITAFGAIPSLYAMRGYDVMMGICKELDENRQRFLIDLNKFDKPILQTPYRFAQLGGAGSKFENVRWVWVTYRPDYTIEVR